MNKLTRQITALGLGCALCLGSMCAVFAEGQVKQGAEKKVTAVSEKKTEQMTVTECVKDETVYVLAGADGSVQKIIVSDWIQNTDAEDSIVDKTELSQPENIKGDESYTLNSNGMKVWDAKGGDIYYQGISEKDLPVGLTIRYSLDGKTVSADELAGKSGKVTIQFDYENRQYEMADINGKTEKIYVPFVMLTGLMLDSDSFRNVEVSNGKLINDGDHTVVIGIALPSLQENLALDREKLEIPEYVEIKADVTDFQLGMTVTLASNALWDAVDTETIKTDKLTDSMDKLLDGMTRLLDGSSALYDGLCTLLEKSGSLVSGIDRLAAGAKRLKNGTDELAGGTTELQAGAMDLAEGLETLSSNSQMLNNGAEQVFYTLLSTATQQIRASGIEIPDLTVENYADTLLNCIAQLDEDAVYEKALQEVTAAVEAQRLEITKKVTEAVQEQITLQVTEAIKQQVSAQVENSVKDQISQQEIYSVTGMTVEQYEAAVEAGETSTQTQEKIASAITEKMESADVQSLIAANTDTQMKSESIQNMISANVTEKMNSEEAQSMLRQNVAVQIQQAIVDTMNSQAVQQQLSAASAGAKQLIALKTSLDDYSIFYSGILAYTAGVDSASDGASALSGGAEKLKTGALELQSGAGELYDGLMSLQESIPSLTEGITKLRDGAMELSDGLKQFNEEGVEKIAEYMGNDLGDLIARLKATIEASHNYRNYAGIPENMKGQVKFIFRTDEVKNE